MNIKINLPAMTTLDLKSLRRLIDLELEGRQSLENIDEKPKNAVEEAARPTPPSVTIAQTEKIQDEEVKEDPSRNGYKLILKYNKNFGKGRCWVLKLDENFKTTSVFEKPANVIKNKGYKGVYMYFLEDGNYKYTQNLVKSYDDVQVITIKDGKCNFITGERPN